MLRSAKPAVWMIAFSAFIGFFGIWGINPASAATDTITIASASSPPSAVGDLTVVADSTTAITSLSVHLLDSAGTDVLDPAMTMSSQTPTSAGFESTWAVTAPIAEGTAPAGLALGNYPISVDAADAGTTLSDPDAGTLIFKDEPTITLSADHTDVSYDSQTVTISGQVTILAPDGTTTPDANGTVSMASSFGPTATLATDANGQYSDTIKPRGGDWVGISISPTATVASGQAPDEISFTLQPDPVHLTAKLSAQAVTYGAKVTVSGSVGYLPGATASSDKPLTGQPVDVYSAQNPYTPAARGTTDSAGNFAITLPPSTDTTWTVDAGSSVVGGNPYLGPATAKLAMSVGVPTVITSFHAKLNQYWQLSFSGCMGLKQAIPNTHGELSGMTIQYSVGRPTGPWRTLTRAVKPGNSCGTHGISFHGTATARSNYAYYRAVFPGVKVSGIGRLLPATSGKVLAWKYADRITSLSVSPHVVARGHKMTVKGQLQWFSSRWRNYGGQQVLIILRPKGSGTWYWIVKVKTNSTGHFSATFVDPVTATWSALYEGNARHLATQASQVYVRLKG